ncbi:hypothetical protein HRbin33_00081 [bacterium HR33]|nr:hypothetical protein HRbin33_00081 [bacterium HR33]
MAHLRSIAVILGLNGKGPDLPTLVDLPRGRLVRLELACGERAVCLAATLEHECSRAELLAALRGWAEERGWSVTVAPLAGGD